ncbi:MAG: type IX secretion system PorP/SprF family membrane protein [Planctomycetota bacterium]
MPPKFKFILMKKLYFLLFISCTLFSLQSNAQQDPQYTQYMYNPQTINPAYAGSRDATTFGLLLRTQWVSLEGAPKTGTFSANTPLGALENMGLGFSIVSETIGPSVDTNVTVDYAYHINTNDVNKLSFGIKAGIDLLDVDFNKLQVADLGDPRFQNNIDNKLQPQFGAGVFYYSDNYYIGLSTPNILKTKHFDESSLEDTQVTSVGSESIHYFLSAGYVLKINDGLKFKPATLIKAVSGAPLQWDVSANFLYNEKFTLGLAYRWSAAMSGMAGFQVSDEMFIGVAYDYQTTDIEAFGNGSYEMMLRYDIFNKPERVLTPRFF